MYYMFVQMSVTNASMFSSVKDVEDLIHNFLIIILEHSMREKDGWKVVIFCVIVYK